MDIPVTESRLKAQKDTIAADAPSKAETRTLKEHARVHRPRSTVPFMAS
jgi:hypothetical protein